MQENTGIDSSKPKNGNISQHNDNSTLAHPAPIDDKAAALEDELLERTTRFNNERFVYLFVIVVLVDAFMGSFAPGTVFGFLIISSLILLIGLAKWLEFPWIIEHLSRWEHLFFRLFERKEGIDPDFEP